MEPPNESDEIESACRVLCHSEPESAPGRASERVQGGARVGELLEYLPGVGEEDPTGLGEAHRAAGAIEDPNAEFGLEPGDLVAQCRLGHVASGRGPSKALFIGNGDDVFELAGIHTGVRCYRAHCTH